MAAETLKLYPGANILVATRKDFETSNRKKFCARIVTGDYDAIIIGHSQFEKIPVSRKRQECFIQEQIDEITDGIKELRRPFPQAEELRKKSARLARLNIELTMPEQQNAASKTSTDNSDDDMVTTL